MPDPITSSTSTHISPHCIPPLTYVAFLFYSFHPQAPLFGGVVFLPIAVADGYKWLMFKMLYVFSESQRCSHCVWILWARQYTSRGRQCCTSRLVLLCPNLNNNYNRKRGFVCQSTFSFSCKSHMVGRIIISKEHALEKERWWNSNGLERKCKFHLNLFIQG